MRLLTAGVAAAALAAAASAASAQGQPSTDGVARAGSSTGSSAITPTRAPARKPAAPVRASAARHRLPSNATGMGSQGANATGATTNSH